MSLAEIEINSDPGTEILSSHVDVQHGSVATAPAPMLWMARAPMNSIILRAIAQSPLPTVNATMPCWRRYRFKHPAGSILSVFEGTT